MCVEIVLKILTVYKSVLLFFLKDSAKLHWTKYVLYTLNVRVLKIFRKNYKSQSVCWNFLENFFLSIQKCVAITF